MDSIHIHIHIHAVSIRKVNSILSWMCVWTLHSQFGTEKTLRYELVQFFTSSLKSQTFVNDQYQLIYLIRNDKVHKPMILVHSSENKKKNAHDTHKKRKKNQQLRLVFSSSSYQISFFVNCAPCFHASWNPSKHWITHPQFINCWLCRLLATYLKIDAFRHCQVQFNHNS